MSLESNAAVLEACRIAAGWPRAKSRTISVPGDDCLVWRNGRWAPRRRAYPGEIAMRFDEILFPVIAYLITADGPVVVPSRGLAEEIEVVLPDGRELLLPRPRQ
jgi:hypothetical protein